MTRTDVDCLIIGGGFYGCCLALFLRSVTDRVLVVEADTQLMNRASRVNQARIHTGFHYPRSVLTAVKSMVLHRRFAMDFPDAVTSNFQMLYAIARKRSKVSAKRFFKMFSDMGAPIAAANPMQAALFSRETIEDVFACQEYAFDFSVLRDLMAERLPASGVDVRLKTEALEIEERADHTIVRLSDGSEVSARHVFNVTYAQINSLLRSAALPQANLKYEVTEIALVEPPRQMEGYGITIMDGPFLSVMPYPSEKLYSLTHVRYTPHHSWTDATDSRKPYDVLSGYSADDRYRHMIADGQRYVPSLAEAQWVKSIYDVKTVLVKSESDDGRPILYQRLPQTSRVTSILGGKIDNIYDLFDLVRHMHPEWREAHSGLVTGHDHPLAASA